MEKCLLFDIWLVFDPSGLLISGIMLGEIPHDFAIFGIERVNKSFSNAQGDHGNTVGVIDVPTGVFVFVVKYDVFNAIGLEASASASSSGPGG